MSYLFTSESVSEGHPDKIADQISDELVDNFLAWDPDSKVACETLVTTGQVVLAGEVKSKTYLDVQEIARDVIRRIGYTKSAYMFEANSCGILSAIHEQSPDINQGVERGDKKMQGAGDQGMMFGYATNETKDLMPLALDLSHRLLWELAQIRKEGKVMTYLRPDAKSQVTIEYGDDDKAIRVHTIVLSTQHDDFIKPANKSETAKKAAEKKMLDQIEKDVRKHVLPRLTKSLSAPVRKLFDSKYILHVNPTGVFIIGGPHGDTGLTGRKIIVDTYGGKGAHGGGAFSGKDPSKVDRSAAYATRHIARNMVAAGICDEVLVQVAYAIGVAHPVSLHVDTFGTAKVDMPDSRISKIVNDVFDMTPYAIEKRFKLRTPIYAETAAYGHMGRSPKTVKKTFRKVENGKKKIKVMNVNLFPWERNDYVPALKKAFKLK